MSYQLVEDLQKKACPKRRHANQHPVQPKSKDRPGRDTCHHRHDCHARCSSRVNNLLTAVASTGSRKQHHPPHQKTAKQHGVSQRAIGQQMRQRPDLGAKHYRVMQLCFDLVAPSSSNQSYIRYLKMVL